MTGVNSGYGRSGATGSHRSPFAALAGLLPLVAGLVAWVLAYRTPPLTVRRCVAPDEPLAWLGAHLEVLHADPGCAAGRYALDGGAPNTTGIVVMVVVPTLAWNLALLLGAVGVWAALRGTLLAATGFVGRWWPRLPDSLPAVALPAGPPPAPPAALRPPRAMYLDRCPVRRRGPPASQPAR